MRHVIKEEIGDERPQLVLKTCLKYFSDMMIPKGLLFSNLRSRDLSDARALLADQLFAHTRLTDRQIGEIMHISGAGAYQARRRALAYVLTDINFMKTHNELNRIVDEKLSCFVEK